MRGCKGPIYGLLGAPLWLGPPNVYGTMKCDGWGCFPAGAIRLAGGWPLFLPLGPYGAVLGLPGTAFEGARDGKTRCAATKRGYCACSRRPFACFERDPGWPCGAPRTKAQVGTGRLGAVRLAGTRSGLSPEYNIPDSWQYVPPFFCRGLTDGALSPAKPASRPAHVPRRLPAMARRAPPNPRFPCWCGQKRSKSGRRSPRRAPRPRPRAHMPGKLRANPPAGRRDAGSGALDPHLSPRLRVFLAAPPFTPWIGMPTRLGLGPRARTRGHAQGRASLARKRTRCLIAPAFKDAPSTGCPSHSSRARLP